MEERGSRSELQLVIFQLAEETYGVEIGFIREIITLQRITKVPRTPPFVEGIINLRGRIIPVIDLRKRFDMPEAPLTEASRIVVVEIEGEILGMIVDAVSEVLRVSTSQIEEPSSFVVGADSRYIAGVVKLEERLVIQLDLGKVFRPEEFEQLRGEGARLQAEHGAAEARGAYAGVVD